MEDKRKIKALDRRYDAEKPSAINTDMLEMIPYEYKGKDTVIDIETGEFTAVCPYSGLPDFGHLRIHYVPGAHLIELRSLKYYLFSFRNVGIYQEHIVQRVLNDLKNRFKPKWIKVELDYNVRGGLHTVACAEGGRVKRK
jgi:7-cyano-7-deazaguanine reductase